MRQPGLFALLIGMIALTLSPLVAQSNFPPEEFSAVAMVNNDRVAGANRVEIRVTRWTAETERAQLVNALVQKGPDDLLKALMRTKPAGFIKTPDSLGYDLHFASQHPGEDGGRDIVIATDRPIGFWEASHRPRTIDYPFTVIQMHLDQEGEGKGTMSYATKVRVKDQTIELENFDTAPVMLTEIQARPYKS